LLFIQTEIYIIVRNKLNYILIISFIYIYNDIISILNPKCRLKKMCISFIFYGIDSLVFGGIIESVAIGSQSSPAANSIGKCQAFLNPENAFKGCCVIPPVLIT